jgi:chemotaxis protein methyltransferase CheR
VADTSLTPQLFAIFTRLIEDACGIHYTAADRELLGLKLEAAAEAAGFPGLLDYYYRLRYDDQTGDELRTLVESLVVHETYFFRELPPLVQLIDTHIAGIVAAGGRARIWSAACSTGEEPYTLAMLLAERGILDRVEIVASDISEPALAKARAGAYRGRSLRDGHPPALAARYLERSGTGFSVAPRLRDAVRFQRHSLLDTAAFAALGHFDAILCRNVMIYFADATVQAVIDRLADRLSPHGLLVVGVSESLLRYGTTLMCEERGGSFFYRRAA